MIHNGPSFAPGESAAFSDSSAAPVLRTLAVYVFRNFKKRSRDSISLSAWKQSFGSAGGKGFGDQPFRPASRLSEEALRAPGWHQKEWVAAAMGAANIKVNRCHQTE